MVDISVSPSMNRCAVTSCIFELYDLSSDCGPAAHCISKIALQCAKRQAASAHFLFDNVSWIWENVLL